MTTVSAHADVRDVGPGAGFALRPPVWLIAATGALTALVLVMAVAETNLWMHYLIDGGEFVSLVGLGFVVVAGFYLYWRRRLLVSLPLFFPWLLFPVITQGDQIIDNLTINQMRAMTHILLAAIFATPVAVLVLAARYALVGRERIPGWAALAPGLRPLAAGRAREGTSLLAAALLTLEIGIAAEFLGLLMVATLIVLVVGVLFYGSLGPTNTTTTRPAYSERYALGLVVAGVALSFGLYVGYENRPGAYQGSPSYFMDPSQSATGYPIDRITVPPGPPATPASGEDVREALTAYGHTLEELLAGYLILDRNYNYHFHNELFVRHTPLLENYRTVGLQRVHESIARGERAAPLAASARKAIPDGDPLAALVDEVVAYVAFNLDRAPILERMSARFEQTRAGLQHATHLYEGEGKVLGVRLLEIVQKHRAVFDAPATAEVTRGFRAVSQSIHDTYANRIVGF